MWHGDRFGSEEFLDKRFQLLTEKGIPIETLLQDLETIELTLSIDLGKDIFRLLRGDHDKVISELYQFPATLHQFLELLHRDRLVADGDLPVVLQH